MKNYKILQVLKALNSKELRSFGEFVNSPYFNKNEPVRRLFDSLEKFHPSYNNRNLVIEKIFKKVFPGDEYDYHKINNVISDLYKLSEKFLAYQQAESSEFFIERNIFRSLRNKKLFKIYEQKHAAYMKSLIDRDYKDEDYFFYLYEINDEYLWYATIKNPNAELNVLQTEFDHFFKFSLLRLLRFYSLMLHERSNSNVKYTMTMFNEVMEYLNKEKPDEEPSLLIFKTILFLLHTKEKKYYTELWSLKDKYLDGLKHDDRMLVYIHLYDFAAIMVNSNGDDSYNKDMFLIYREMIDNGMMSPENFLYPNFMNIVKIACRVGEFDYAEKVIIDFAPSLPAEEKENVLAFCYGTIQNSKGNLREALKFFSKSNFQNFIFKVQVKILLLKINYRLGMFEQALGMIDTFKHYVAREDNLLPDHRESYNQFLNLMTEFIRIAEDHNEKEKEFRLQKVLKEAEKMPANPFRIKVWMIDEIKKLL